MSQFVRTVARNSAFGMAAHVAVKALSFLFSVLIIRRLGADEFGQYSAVLAFGAIFVFFADLGLSPYTVRQVARLRDLPDGHQQIRLLFGTVLALRFFLSLATAMAIIAVAWLTGRPQEMILGVALGTIGLILYSVQGAAESILVGYERVDISAGAHVAHQFAFVMLGTLALTFAAGYYGLIFANLAGIALMTVICWRAVQRLDIQPSAPVPSMWVSLIKASLPFGVIGFTLGLSYKFDSVLLNIYAGDMATGYYTSAYNLIFSVLVISNVVNIALYPSLTRQSISHPQSLPAIQERMLRYLLIIALPIAVGGSMLAPQIIDFLYGAAYANAALPLAILIWVVPFMFVTEFMGYVIVVEGAERRVAWAITLSTTLNVLLNLLLIPVYGLLAAAILTVATEAILLGQYSWLLRNKLRAFDWGLILGRPLLALMVMAVALLGLRSLWLPVAVGLGAVIYASMLLLFGVIGKTELGLFTSIRQQGEQSRG